MKVQREITICEVCNKYLESDIKKCDCCNGDFCSEHIASLICFKNKDTEEYLECLKHYTAFSKYLVEKNVCEKCVRGKIKDAMLPLFTKQTQIIDNNDNFTDMSPP